MKDEDNRRRTTAGSKTYSALWQQGYQYQYKKQIRHKGWRVHPDHHSPLLTYVPVSVGNWSLIPSNTKETRAQLWGIVQRGIVQNALYAIREKL